MGFRDFMERSKSSITGGTKRSLARRNTSRGRGEESKSLGAASSASSFRTTLVQLVGDNPPLGSVPRVVRRKYRSVTIEREMEFSDYDQDVDAVVLYEVEFPRNPNTSQIGTDKNVPLGIELETDFYGDHAVVKEIKRGSVAYSLSRVIKPGHFVVAINGKDLSTLTFAEVLHELKTAESPRVIRFLDPLFCPIRQLRHETQLVNRDQFGFAKDDKYILSYRKILRKRKIMNYEHEKKWAEFISNNNGLDEIDRRLNDSSLAQEPDTLSLRQQLRRLVLGGVPVVLRTRVWSILAHVSTYRAQFPQEYYQNLVNRNTSPSLADIDKDVCRTYPEHPFFQTTKGKEELRRVLSAYAHHNPTIGYCQSMNFIVGMMLLFMEEQEAFWLLCAVIEYRYLPAENYMHSMVGTQTDQLVFKHLVAKELPALSERLETNGILIHLITMHWFLCAFVCTLPTESALRVWDWFFLDGEEVLFTVAIGILRLAEGPLLNAKTHSELHLLVRELGTDLHDEEELMKFLYGMAESDDLETIAEDNDDDDDDDDDDEEEGEQHGEVDEHEEEGTPETKEIHSGNISCNGSSSSRESPAEATLANSTSSSTNGRSRRRRTRNRDSPTTLGSRLHSLLQKLPLTSPDVSSSFQKRFTIVDIHKLRQEYRQQIENPPPSSVNSKCQ